MVDTTGDGKTLVSDFSRSLQVGKHVLHGLKVIVDPELYHYVFAPLCVNAWGDARHGAWCAGLTLATGFEALRIRVEGHWFAVEGLE